MKKVGWVVVIVVIAAIGGFGYRLMTQSKVHSEVIFKESRVERGQIELTVLSTGVVQPKNRLEIKPPIAGRIEKILVDEGQYVKKGQILAWMSSTERAALIDAASAKGTTELEYWKSMYQQTPILAPINGMIILRNVETGQTFTTQDAVLVMSDKLTIKAQVDETDIGQVKLKQEVKVVLDAYPDQSFLARVDEIAFDATTVNNVTTYVVDIIPHATPSFMRSGMTANVVFAIAKKHDVLLVPADAVKTRDDYSYVLIPAKEEGEEPIEIKVTVGLSDVKQVEIISGLSEGDIILVPELNFDAKQTNTSPLSPFRPRPRKN